MNLEYMGYRTDLLAFAAGTFLLKLGAPVHQLSCDYTMRDALVENPGVHFALLFTCEGEYPSQHYRILRERDIQLTRDDGKTPRYHIPPHVPAWGDIGSRYLTYVALRPCGKVREYFPQSIKDLHARLTGTSNERPVTRVQRMHWKQRRSRVRACCARTSGGWGDSL